MLNSPTIEKLKDLKLKVMAQMLSEPERGLLELSFEDRLAIMVEKQWYSRKNARIKRLLSAARLTIADACLEDIYYSDERTIDKKLICSLSTSSYIEQKLNVILSGKTGSGKSFIASALGNSACRNGYRTLCYRVPELLLEIQEAKDSKRYFKFMDNLKNVRLLILDDVGLKSYNLEESRDILEIAEARYSRSSTILIAQFPHSKWYDLFADPTIADAVMDRVIHNAYIMPLDSKHSMREVIAEKTKKNLEK
jgi:DNA replication protein DnaC